MASTIIITTPPSQVDECQTKSDSLDIGESKSANAEPYDYEKVSMIISKATVFVVYAPP